MSALPAHNTFGVDLTSSDLNTFSFQRWITPELLEQAMIRRVDSWTGREMFGRKGGDCSGLIIPFTDPATGNIVEFQIRLDNPDMEAGADGELKPKTKYLLPYGRRNRAYFVPGTDPALLADASMPITITEGAWKALALHRLSTHETEKQRFLSIALTGVYNFKASIGKTTSTTGERTDVKGFLPELEQINWKDRNVYVAYDSDVLQNPKVRSARWKLTQELQQRGAKVGYLEWRPDQAKGIDDLLAAVGPDEVLGLLNAVDFADDKWRRELIVNKTGKACPLLSNALTPLRHSPDWIGVLAYSEFDAGIYTRRQPPFGGVAREWSDQEDRLTVEWLQRRGIHVGVDVTGQAIQTVAQERSFHPVRDYLSALRWDGEARLDNWLLEYAGVSPDQEQTEADPEKHKANQEKFISYCKAIARKWMISAVARVFKPGCKADHVLILEGAQGLGKSTTAKILGGEWYCDELPEIGSKDASQQVRGTWILELSELDVLSRAEAGRIKSFISRATDKYRPPYARRPAEFPRQCVFIGTTNGDSYLRDETGGRRFWPVKCRGKIELEKLTAARDQLWAEAVAAFKAGETWYLDDPDMVQQAQQEQRERYEGDAWDTIIMEWANARINTGSASVSVAEALELGLEKKRDAWTKGDEMRVGRCLTAGKWERFRDRKMDMEWRYRPPKVVSE